MAAADVLKNQNFAGVKKKYLTPVFVCSMITKSHGAKSGGNIVKPVNESKEKAVGHVSLEQLEYKGMLYDFYGELLTPHQKNIYEDVVFNDLSLGEIAGEQGISRQGVHDLIKRCDRILNDYENKLHLVEKFARIKHNIQQINELTDDEQIKQLSNEIIEEL